MQLFIDLIYLVIIKEGIIGQKGWHESRNSNKHASLKR
jgi:hypothetical protein